MALSATCEEFKVFSVLAAGEAEGEPVDGDGGDWFVSAETVITLAGGRAAFKASSFAFSSLIFSFNFSISAISFERFRSAASSF